MRACYRAAVLIALTTLLILSALPTMSALAGAEDCLPYNPSALTIQAQGDYWLLTDGQSSILALDNQDDANKALAVARQHTARCFIGRDNTRSNRRDYIVQYWTGSSGLPATSFAEDCIPFDPATLTIVPSGSDFLVTSGTSSLLALASQVDAQSVLNVVNTYHYVEHCFIGRGNTRTDRKSFIMEYWKPAGNVILNTGVIQIDPGVLQVLASPTLTPEIVLLNPNVIQIDPGVLQALPTFTPTPAPAIQPAQPVGTGDDCIVYDPASLYVVPEGDHWLLTNGQVRMNLLDNQNDANDALGIAQQHTAACYIGRGNTRPNPADYVFLYWMGDSGMGHSSSDSDCYQYNPDILYVVPDGDHWLLTDGLVRMHNFDTQDEANKALNLVKPYNGQCYLGRGNTRPDYANYVFPYWTRLPIGMGQQGQDQPPTPTLVMPGAPSGPSPTPQQGIVLLGEDCVAYSPAALYVVQQDDHWLLTDGLQALLIFDTQDDGNRALTIAQEHTYLCFIGRNNTRPDRFRYVTTYFK